jgi:hypothetical protein
VVGSGFPITRDDGGSGDFGDLHLSRASVVRFWFSDPRLSVLMRNKILFSELGCSPRLRASVVRFCFFLISVYPRQSAVSF